MTLSTLFALALGGCNDGDDGGGGGSGGTFESSVDSGKKVSDLTDAERDAFCEESNDFIVHAFSDDEAKRLACGLAAVLAGAFALDDASRTMLCEEAYAACLEAPAQEGEPGQENGCFLDSLGTDCEAPVTLVEACINDDVDSLRTFANEFACQDVDWDEGESEPMGPCADLSAQCG